MKHTTSHWFYWICCVCVCVCIRARWKGQKKEDYFTHLCQLWRPDLLNLEEITDGEEGDGHRTDADHKNDQRGTVVDVAPQVLYRV